ncbi:calponin homology domain-containing protein DDB_G0272472-like [Drosophila takahashii]|uniref:calponin homology domain-containing protein DDB_G0272472-like n=1 Tax=Drosophila takahashii TaxID=29030 RepID=UPI00389937FA
MEEKPSRKRTREVETKRWSESEVDKILDYMLEHKNVEKPTAQLYYKKLLETTKIDASWNSLRFKVRHLKLAWRKAEDFCRSTGAGIEEEDSETTIEAKILKMCPKYYLLRSIFFVEKDLDIVVHESQNYEGSIIEIPEEKVDIDIASDLSFEGKTKRKTEKTAIAKLQEMDSERMKFRQDTLALEREKFMWSKELENRKLEIEEKRLDNDMKKLKMELEHKERMLKMELDMKK